MLIEQSVRCPYCGETYPSSVDISGGGQEYVEDCSVCCRPITIRVRVDHDGSLNGIEIRREDD
ncbi:MAG: CPXCG motif-containing cysteine-rich protein [Acidiferrobacteraceae bacterium]